MPNDTIICEKSNYQLSLAAPAGSSIIWNDGTNGYTNTITGPNTYIAVANVIGCLHTDSFHVATKPLPVVSLGPDQIICQNISYTAKVSYPGANYLWSNNSTDSFLVIKTSGNYSVEAFLNGCTYSDDLTMTFVKCDCDTKIPSAFSPNGDGINETFKPDMQCVPGNYKMNIFNRSGQLIYETKNYQDAWDGRYNGKPLPIGTYYYIINYLNVGLQKPEQFSGSITILR
jgi:gliding motility-associated-like protein